MLRRTPSPETEVTIREPIREGGTAAEYRLDTWLRPPLLVTLPEGDEPIIGVEHAAGTWRDLRFEHLTHCATPSGPSGRTPTRRPLPASTPPRRTR